MAGENLLKGKKLHWFEPQLEVEEVVVIGMTLYRRPVDDDFYDSYVSLWPDSLCSVCHEILVLCNLYKEL